MSRRRRSTVLECLERFRQATSDSATMNQMVCFLYVAENEGLAVGDLAALARLTEPTASRTVRTLYEPGRDGVREPALGLIRGRVDPHDARALRLSLTDRGATVRDRLDSAIGEAVRIAHPARPEPAEPRSVHDVRECN